MCFFSSDGRHLVFNSIDNYMIIYVFRIHVKCLIDSYELNK